MVLVASGARAQEVWSPAIMVNGTTVSINGQTSPVANGPVESGVPTPGNWGVPNPALAYPNGVVENARTSEWIVADTYHGRLLRFATDHHPTQATGAFLGAIATSLAGEVSCPYSPVVDDDGVIVVPDRNDHSLKAFVPSGTGANVRYTAHRIARFANGSLEDTFHEPIRLVLLPDQAGHVRVEQGIGAMLVLDSASARVLKLNLTGGVVHPQWSVALSFGESASARGTGPGRFYYPTGLAVDPAGNIYVTDPNNSDVTSLHVFRPDGTPLTIVSGLSAPWGVAVDRDGRVFVAETGDNAITVFDKYDATNPAASLAPLFTRIGTPSLPLGGLSLPEGVNPAGPAGELQEPTAIAFDQFGRLLVADSDNFRLQVFDRPRIGIAAVATPTIVTATDSFVDVAVTVRAPQGGSEPIDSVVPSVPVAIFSAGARPGIAVVATQPDCVITPASGDACVGLDALRGQTLMPGGRFDHVFRFSKVAGSPGPVGPVWFSVAATGVIPAAGSGTGGLVVSASGFTHAVAVGGELAGAPVLSEPRLSSDPQNPDADTSSNGWFRTQPAYVHLNAQVPDPGEKGDGYVQEIQYHFGRMPPGEGEHLVCFDSFGLDAEQAPSRTAACSIPFFKEGITKLWYRALSTRGLYDRMLHDAVTAVSVPAWSSVDVKLDLSRPYVLFSYAADAAPGHYGWFNSLPLQVGMMLVDVGSQLAAASVSGPGLQWSLATSDVPFAPYALSFGASGIHRFTINATDRAGNVRNVDETIKIDTLAPAVTYSSAPSGVPGAGGIHWYATLPGGVTFTATGDDGPEGIGFSGGQTATQTFSVTRTGTKVTATFTDLLGNTANASASYSFDPIPPIVLPPTPRAPDALVGAVRWYKAPITVTFNASDGIGSGFRDPVTLQFTPTLVRVATSATGGIVGETFVDLVGNPAFKAAGPFNFDQAGPAVTSDVRYLNDAPATGMPSGGVTWFTQPVKVVFAATDPGIGFSSSTPTPTASETATIADGVPHTLTRTFTDRLGNATTVTVGPFAVDAVAPHLVVPAGVSVPALGVATSVAFTVLATDALDPAPAVVCDPASGHLFAPGTTRVNCSARDAAGNQAAASFDVTVSRTAPAIALPPDRTVEATGTQGAYAAFTAAASDVVDGTVPVVCAPASGALFPLGRTVVSCSATNSGNVTSTQTFTVAVVDTTAPALAQASVSLIGAGPSGARANFAPVVTDAVSGGQLPVVCRPPSGSMFPIGSTDVICRATDTAGNTGHVVFRVIVAHAAPVCSAAASTSGLLWPPNHRLETIGITGVPAADGSAVSIRVDTIFQDEPTVGQGSGDMPIDGFGIGGAAAQVRAERSSDGDGRVYYIGFTATSAGGSCSGTVTASVPHDKGKGPAVGGGPLYDSTRR